MISTTNKSHPTIRIVIKILASVLIVACLAVGYYVTLRSNNNDQTIDINASVSSRRLADISRWETCATLECCGPRNINSQFDRICSTLSLEKCVYYNKICIWNCDEYQKDTKRRGTFVGFDEGNGEIDDKNVTDEEGQYIDEGEPTTPQEIKKAYDYYEWSPCGDVYEYELSYAEAVEILKDGSIYRVSVDDSDNDEYPDNEREGEDGDRNRRRNLLTLFFPDERSLSLSQNSYPRSVIGILVTDSGSWCTGTLISRRIVLTAAHCLYDTGSNSWTGGWTFYPDTIDDTTFGTGYRWAAARVTKRWADQTKTGGSYDTWSSSRDCDYGMVILSVSNTYQGWMSYGYDTSLPSSTFNTYGYPGDKDNGTRWFQYCPHTLYSQQTRSTDCDVWPGQSGSSNYLYWPSTNRRIIYALTSGQTGTYNVYSRIDKTKFNFICDTVDDFDVSVC